MSDCKHEKRTDYVLKHPRYVSYCQNCDADFTKFELETLERAEKAEALAKELEEDLKGEAMELQAKKILLNNAGLTISKYQSKLSDVTLEWIAATERVKELEAKAQVCMDLHEALGVKFGDDPYARIISLQKAEARVKELEDAIASALRIKQLWGPPDDVENLLYSGPDDNVADEYRALHSMLTKFEELVK